MKTLFVENPKTLDPLFRWPSAAGGALLPPASLLSDHNHGQRADRTPMSQVKASFRSERRNRGATFLLLRRRLSSGLRSHHLPCSGVSLVSRCSCGPPSSRRWEILSRHLFRRWPLARRWSSARRWPPAQCDIEIHPPVSLSRTRHRSQRIRDSFRE
ncbi:hypothetical protein K1719_027017 [Acacia pycnantha]|nr:hypothetical protein K1719_027017 [Acacia pycnantha]